MGMPSVASPSASHIELLQWLGKFALAIETARLLHGVASYKGSL